MISEVQSIHACIHRTSPNPQLDLQFVNAIHIVGCAHLISITIIDLLIMAKWDKCLTNSYQERGSVKWS